MNEADTPQECSSDNRKVSFLIAAVVHASPFFMMMRGYWGALKAKSSSQVINLSLMINFKKIYCEQFF